MADNLPKLPFSSYTPEYSRELLNIVKSTFSYYVKPKFPKLKLENLIDLLEETEYHFEQYKSWLNNKLKKGNIIDTTIDNGSNDNKDDIFGLVEFIIGSFYIYLIIPESIQFHSINKSYSLYLDMRKIYQDESNMSNVLLMVVNQVTNILQQNQVVNDVTKINRRRAYSITSTKSKNLSINNQDNNVASKNYPNYKGNDRERGEEYDDDEDEDDDDNSIFWKAPETTRNDHLIVPSIINKTPTQLQEQPPFFSPAFNKDYTNTSTFDVNRYQTHRKDSYHSIYMWPNEEEEQDDSMVQLLKVQTTSSISAENLFRILSDQNKSNELLLIDLRLRKRYEANHLVSKYIINIDPSLFKSPNGGKILESAIQLDSTLKTSLPNDQYKLFNNISSFKYVVYYTDMKTYMNIDFDYQLKFFQILYTSDLKLQHTPKILLGGYDQWKKLLHIKGKESPNFNSSAYLYRREDTHHHTHQHPHVTSTSLANSSSTSSNSSGSSFDATKNIDKVLLSGVADMSSVSQPPALPPKILVSQNASTAYNRPRMPIPQKRLQNGSYNTKELARTPSNQAILIHGIPTIEASSNEYVSLSVAGLRNLGNTCYINAMVQCLFGTPVFRGIFLSSKYREYFQPEYKKKYQLSKSFHTIFTKMYMNGGCSVVPSGFLKSCNLLRPDLNIPTDQQDTQEFLLFVLDQLHDELSNKETVLKDYPNLLLHSDDLLCVNPKMYDKWFEENFNSNGVSPIDEIFQGQIENCLQCQRCGYSSYNYSTFYVLSLAIPRVESSKLLKTKKKKKIKLEDCINLFTNDEILAGDNAWDCPKCGTQHSSFKEKENIRSRAHIKTNKEDNTESNNNHSSNKSSKGFFNFHHGHHYLRSRSPFRKEANGSTSNEENILISPSDSSLKRRLWKSHSSNTENVNNSSKLNNTTDDGNNGKGWSGKLTTLKSLNFITMPPILIVHLSRFYYDLTKKNDAIVTYPLILNIVLKNNSVVKYRLYGLVNHSGNLISGHYTALVNKDLNHSLNKDAQRWYYFDDEAVKLDNNHGDIDEGVISVSSRDVYLWV
ncbi:ubiquitin-specific protease UBP7 SCDLUD_005314 [Saccharomycodes ludwigii]|uniref:ubiquitin-specific protease UBP7 n=1 Tax=Saccharomycodes ludwigii TaxID=36035 RepID=UPI001E82FC4A|nr:hypothetical protein SCDLUD_005314 [Saccharomycodes ludwigii]KAH3898967.1 hypothetical protein SCDLUD_005314 [Saccharomycodes ludwigii]